MKVGQSLVVSKLEALPRATNGRSSVAFRAEEIKAVGVASVKTGWPRPQPGVPPWRQATHPAPASHAVMPPGPSLAALPAGYGPSGRQSGDDRHVRRLASAPGYRV